jgi:parallel beta-helix repeat protein
MKSVLRSRLLFFALLIAAAFLSTPMYALSCGDPVLTNTVLNQDLNCTGAMLAGSGAALTVYSGVTLDLNGHTISCTDPSGYQGSCQTTKDAVEIADGISIFQAHNVTIQGPGTIKGFTTGITATGGSGIRILGVTITGPAPTPNAPPSARVYRNNGIMIYGVPCPLTSTFVPSASIVYNNISQQTSGVVVEGSGCVQVIANQIHDNIGTQGDGIDLISSSNNTVTDNQVVNNGSSLYAVRGSGIAVYGFGSNVSSGNQIVNNSANGNCGNGIWVGDSAINNNVALNFALNNATTPACGTILYDVNGLGQGPGNIWNTNNTCKTQSGGIPPGVCP